MSEAGWHNVFYILVIFLCSLFFLDLLVLDHYRPTALDDLAGA